MASRTVLVAGVGETVAGLEAAFHEAGASPAVRHLDELSELIDRLTRSAVDCLVVPAEIEDVSAWRVGYGVRSFFPALPVVVVGPDPDAVPADLNVTAVPAGRIDDPEVVAAVLDALEGGVDSDAARAPSRMETLLLSMFDQFPVHLYAKDAAARHALTSRYSMSPTALIGLTDLDYVELPKDHREAAYRDDMDIIEGDQQALEIEEYTDYLDSHTLTSKVPWYDEDGDVVGLVGLTRDITQRKKREHAARRQQELLVKLAILAAHEFRNELQVALGRLELLEADPDRFEEQIGVIAESHDRLIEIVDKVVDLASRERPMRGETTVWLSKLGREVWDTLDTDGATMRVETDARMTADPESASLFLQILFDNAVEHAGPDVTVTVSATENGFVVADDGPGIAVEPLERIFDAGVSTVEGNTGFGLFVAKSVADEHNWRLEAADAADGGARFEITGLNKPDA
ncbi:MAG: ATP-binding protein [Haloarculaceae archaeon]